MPNGFKETAVTKSARCPFRVSTQIWISGPMAVEKPRKSRLFTGRKPALILEPASVAKTALTAVLATLPMSLSSGTQTGLTADALTILATSMATLAKKRWINMPVEVAAKTVIFPGLRTIPIDGIRLMQSVAASLKIIVKSHMEITNARIQIQEFVVIHVMTVDGLGPLRIH